MKTLEIRRHSIREKPGQNLSQQGVTLARKIGETMGNFNRVITSPVPRAFQTALAMGYAVNATEELLSTYGEAVEIECREGVRLTWDDGKFTTLQVLRVSLNLSS